MLSIGDLIDARYRITSELGRGGMALVYQARDEHLARDVALKVLRPHLTESDHERFQREIKVLAQLSHPHIVSIYDLGEKDYIYFVMELVTGGVITDLGPYEQDVVPALRLLEASISVAEALAYVHRRGMVHRDLTPRNILLTQLGKPKVMDFGLVHLAESSRALTRTGFTLGTPQYMAPEQAQGEGIGAHTDLYAFGAVLYHLLTGVVPFTAENDQAVLYQHVYGELVPVLEHNPYVPPALAHLVEALLRKDPKGRPSSGAALAVSLRLVRDAIASASHGFPSGGSAHQGVHYGGLTMPSLPDVMWQRRLEDGPQYPYQLISAENFLLIGLPNDNLAILHPSDGSVVGYCQGWDEINATPVYQDGTLFFCDRSGGLHCYALPENLLLWQESADATGISSFAGGILLSDRQGLQHRNSNGEALWRYVTESPVTTAATVHRQWLICVTEAGWLHVLNRQGQGQYKIQLGSSSQQLSAADNLLLIPEFAGDLHAFDLEKQDVLWSYDMEGTLWHAPIIWQRRVYQIIWTHSEQAILRCLSLKTGDDVWEQTLPHRCTAAPVLAGGVLYIVSEAGELYSINAENGAYLCRKALARAPLQASPLLSNGTLFIAATDGTVMALR